jgi:hypothetical protein
MKTQKQAVYEATSNVLSDLGIHFTDGMNVCEVITDDARDAIQTIVFEGFRDSAISLDTTDANKDKLSSDSKLKAYVSGLVSNWFRKDKRLNGGTQYIAKNPGSRAGSNDPEVRELRKALKIFEKGSEKHTLCQAAINERITELKPAKVVEAVDTSMIDPELAAALGL